jgi:hypothetical protein
MATSTSTSTSASTSWRVRCGTCTGCCSRQRSIGRSRSVRHPATQRYPSTLPPFHPSTQLPFHPSTLPPFHPPGGVSAPGVMVSRIPRLVPWRAARWHTTHYY